MNFDHIVAGVGVWEVHADTMREAQLDPSEDVLSVSLPFRVVFANEEVARIYQRVLEHNFM
jgi:hypothetical protein